MRTTLEVNGVSVSLDLSSVRHVLLGLFLLSKLVLWSQSSGYENRPGWQINAKNN